MHSLALLTAKRLLWTFPYIFPLTLQMVNSRYVVKNQNYFKSVVFLFHNFYVCQYHKTDFKMFFSGKIYKVNKSGFVMKLSM